MHADKSKSIKINLENLIYSTVYVVKLFFTMPLNCSIFAGKTCMPGLNISVATRHLDRLIKPNWIFQYNLRLIKHKTFQNYRPSTNNYLIIFPVSSEFCNQRWPMIWVYCYKTRIIEWNYSIYSCPG